MTSRPIEQSSSGAKGWRRDPQVAGLIRSQTTLNVVLNAVMPTTLLWLLGVPAPERVLGLGGLLQALLVGVTIGTIVTFVSTRKAVRGGLLSGAVPELTHGELHSVVRFLPKGDVGALVAILALALALVIPAGIVIAEIAHRLPLDKVGFAILNALTGVAVGLWVAPRVVLHALATTRQRII